MHSSHTEPCMIDAAIAIQTLYPPLLCAAAMRHGVKQSHITRSFDKVPREVLYMRSSNSGGRDDLGQTLEPSHSLISCFLNAIGNALARRPCPDKRTQILVGTAMKETAKDKKNHQWSTAHRHTITLPTRPTPTFILLLSYP